MKTQILLFSFLFSSLLSFSQSTGDVVIYSNTGEKFYVVLNGIRQNTMAETNVKVQGLSEEWYSCKIISASQKFEIEKNIAVKMDMQVTYRLTEKKGKYKLKYYSEKAFSNEAEPNQQVVTYHTSETPATKPTTNTSTTTTTTTTNGGSNSNTTTFGMGVSGNSTTTKHGSGAGNGDGNGPGQGNGTGNGSAQQGNGTVKTSTTVNTSGQGQGETESINININMNATETGGNTGVTINESNSTTTTTTTTTTSTKVNGQTTESFEESTTVTNSGSGTSSGMTTTSTTTTNKLYQDDDMTITSKPVATGCVMDNASFQNLKKSASIKDFEDSKMSILKSGIKDKCVSASQVKELAGLFSFEDSRLEFAKYAYAFCSDKGNYFMVNDIFEFESSIEELEVYINR